MPLAPEDYIAALVNAGLKFDGTATDKDLGHCIVQAIATLAEEAGLTRPTDPLLPPREVAPRGSAAEALATFYAKAKAPTIALGCVGEKHDCTEDLARAAKVTAAIADRELVPDLVIFEMGIACGDDLTCGTLRALGLEVVKEEQLRRENVNPIPGLPARTLTPSNTQRNMLIAGYLALDLALGDPKTVRRILLFFGDAHFTTSRDNILSFLITYLKSFGAQHVLLRPLLLMHFETLSDAGPPRGGRRG